MGELFEGLIITTVELREILDITVEESKSYGLITEIFHNDGTPRWMELEGKRRNRRYCIFVCGVSILMALKLFSVSLLEIDPIVTIMFQDYFVLFGKERNTIT